MAKALNTKIKDYLCILTNLFYKTYMRNAILTIFVFIAGTYFAHAQNISFADPNVKAICVANWDTDGDGELNEAEAAAGTHDLIDN